MARLLKSFKDKEIGTELLIEVRDIERRDEQQHAADKTLALDLRKLLGRPAELGARPLAETAGRGAEGPRRSARCGPRAVRGLAEGEGGSGVPATKRQFALAMSGYVVGHEVAVPEPEGGRDALEGRALVREYLVGEDPSGRSDQAAASRASSGRWHRTRLRRFTISNSSRRSSSSCRRRGTIDAVETGKTIIHRVIEDENAEPTEYAVCLPPEYHPLRSYPALVVLHSGDGPEAAIDEWSAEASRRGYILIAPEYKLPGQTPDYRYTTSEHAAVELALRDARKRYAIDSDRVFVAGQLTGGNMAWDYGLAHPDLFAGVVVISGLPAKYVPRYLPHHERLPLYVVLGELAPAANEVDLHQLRQAPDPQDLGRHLRRIPPPRPGELSRGGSARLRLDGPPPTRPVSQVVQGRLGPHRRRSVLRRRDPEFGAGRITAPEAVEILGQNLNPAKIKMKSSSSAT